LLGLVGLYRRELCLQVELADEGDQGDGEQARTAAMKGYENEYRFEGEGREVKLKARAVFRYWFIV
jgi:hypothetical protein